MSAANDRGVRILLLAQALLLISFVTLLVVPVPLVPDAFRDQVVGNAVPALPALIVFVRACAIARTGRGVGASRPAW